VVTSPDVTKSLKLTPADLPAVFMISNEGEGILRYSGEILELNLSEWVLRFSSPAMGELNVDTTQGMVPLRLNVDLPSIMIFYSLQASCTQRSSSRRAS